MTRISTRCGRCVRDRVLVCRHGYAELPADVCPGSGVYPDRETGACAVCGATPGLTEVRRLVRRHRS